MKRATPREGEASAWASCPRWARSTTGTSRSSARRGAARRSWSSRSSSTPRSSDPNEDFARYPRDLAATWPSSSVPAPTLVFAPDRGGDVSARRGDARARRRPRGAALRAPSARGTSRESPPSWRSSSRSRAPCVAVFGKKDYQQLASSAGMTRDLFLPVEVVGSPDRARARRPRDELAQRLPVARGARRARSASRGASPRPGGAFAGGVSDARRAPRAPRATRSSAVATSIDYVERRRRRHLDSAPRGTHGRRARARGDRVPHGHDAPHRQRRAGRRPSSSGGGRELSEKEIATFVASWRRGVLSSSSPRAHPGRDRNVTNS